VLADADTLSYKKITLPITGTLQYKINAPSIHINNSAAKKSHGAQRKTYTKT